MDNPSGENAKRRVVLFQDFLRHPLATMLIGFVLTGVVGTMLTNHFANLRQKEARDVITRLKQLYDDAEARAAVVRQELVLLMREAMQESDFESLRSEIETRLVRKRMRPLRDCVDRAGNRALSARDGAVEMRDCSGYELMAESRACGDVIADGLYDLASVSTLGPSDPHAMQVRAKTQSRIEQACPLS